MVEKDKHKTLVKLDGLTIKDGLFTILNNINLTIYAGESIAITGASGSGKTILGKVLAGKISDSHGSVTFSPSLKSLMVHQQDQFMYMSGMASTYYGQRYEGQGMEEIPTVGEYLQKVSKKIKEDVSDQNMKKIMSLMQIDEISDRKLLQLSNGERKRTQMAAAMLQTPQLFVVDQPFVGLDVESRKNLTDIFNKQMKMGISMVIICNPNEIPSGVNNVVKLSKGEISKFVSREEFSLTPEIKKKRTRVDKNLLTELPNTTNDFSSAVIMKDVHVVMDDELILNKINWQVNKGEQWALLGHNGAGKTTLLSLITADNPQGYSNDLILFDRQRGSGESIWDIKNKIGYVSPELHQYFLRGEGIYNSIPGMKSSSSYTKYTSLTCEEVIGSGFNDEIGLATDFTDLQKKIAIHWLSILNLEHLHGRSFLQASMGEQRLLLLGRALVKSPSLLILDEPCQGLDDDQTENFLCILNDICIHLKTTLIYVTHVKERIPSCIDKLLMLKKGEVEYSGRFER